MKKYFAIFLLSFVLSAFYVYIKIERPDLNNGIFNLAGIVSAVLFWFSVVKMIRTNKSTAA